VRDELRSSPAAPGQSRPATAPPPLPTPRGATVQPQPPMCPCAYVCLCAYVPMHRPRPPAPALSDIMRPEASSKGPSTNRSPRLYHPQTPNQRAQSNPRNSTLRPLRSTRCVSLPLVAVQLVAAEARCLRPRLRVLILIGNMRRNTRQ